MRGAHDRASAAHFPAWTCAVAAVLVIAVHSIGVGSVVAQERPASVAPAPLPQMRVTPELVGGILSMSLGAAATGVGIAFFVGALIPPGPRFCGLLCEPEPPPPRDDVLLWTIAATGLLTGAVGLVTGTILVAVGPRRVPVAPTVVFDLAPLEGGAFARVRLTF